MLKEFGPEIWIAEGPTVRAAAGFHYPTRMAIIRLSNEGLVVWSPVAFSPELGSAVDALGTVYVAGTTDSAGQGAGVMVEVGYGADGVVPYGGSWTWSTATYNGDKDGLTSGDLANDEYAGSFTAPSASGSYDYAGRVSIDSGASWTYCDFGGDSCGGSGTDDGWSSADAGDLTVP